MNIFHLTYFMFFLSFHSRTLGGSKGGSIKKGGSGGSLLSHITVFIFSLFKGEGWSARCLAGCLTRCLGCLECLAVRHFFRDI
eukprot:UN07317